MQNPWIELPTTPPFILPSDKAVIENFNASAPEGTKLHLDLLPEPYLGNPAAKIILLNLNPGFGPRDYDFYKIPSVQKAWKENIRHESTTYPFYLLDPSLKDINGGHWWQQKLKPLIKLTNAQLVAHHVCCIEFFPYHSKHFDASVGYVESQEYSFSLASAALQRDAVVVFMHGQKLWLQAVPALQNYKTRFTLNSSQNVTISEKNCPKGFPFIKKILQNA